MAWYKCSKCGETASSKCVGQRSVFPTNQFATMLGNVLTIRAVRRGSEDERYRREDDSDVWKVTYAFEMGYVRAQDEDEAIRESDLERVLLETPKETLRIALCVHDWQLQSETCDLGCCKRSD